MNPPRIVGRSEWATVPLSGDGDDPIVYVDRAQRTGFIVHWDGGSNPSTEAEEQQWLRNYEAYHRRADDAGGLKYNLAVGPVTGNVYIGRGLDVRGMHTGGANTPNIGCILIGGPGNVTERGKLGLRIAYDLAGDHIGRQLSQLVHSDLNATACPGDEIRAHVKGGGLMGAPVIIWIRPEVGFTAAAGASFRRLEGHVGRIPCNSTYRDYWTQLAMYNAWNAYVNGTGPHPGHSRALHPDDSLHSQGLAVDTDRAYEEAFRREAEAYGWYGVSDPSERHHLEYRSWLDRHFGEPVPAGSEVGSLDPTPAIPLTKGLDMFIIHNTSLPEQKVLITADAGQLRARYLEDKYERAVFLGMEPPLPVTRCDDETFAKFLQRLGYVYGAPIPLLEVTFREDDK